MFFKFKIFSILIVILQLLINSTVSDQPYQVTLWLKKDFHNNQMAKPFCNGVIIHERLILTTGSCLRNTTAVIETLPSSHNITNNNNSNNELNDVMKIAYPPLSSSSSSVVVPESNNNTQINGTSSSFTPSTNATKFIALNASDIIIVAGVSLQQQNRMIYNISEIDIAHNFNITSLENDIALLRLAESLPLANRRDIQWISLDDHLVYKNSSCTIGFYNFWARNNQVTYTIKLLNNQNCTNTTTFQSPRRRDICSLYVNPSICNFSASDLEQNNDRGTGLVCDSKLIGVLSQLIPRENNKTKCSNTDSLKAIYTRVALHLNWIYEKIAIESMADLGKSNHILAPPYKESAPSPHIQMPENSDQHSSIPFSANTTPIPNKNSNINLNAPNGNTGRDREPIEDLRQPKNDKSNGIKSKSISLSSLFSTSIVLTVVMAKLIIKL